MLRPASVRATVRNVKKLAFEKARPRVASASVAILLIGAALTTGAADSQSQQPLPVRERFPAALDQYLQKALVDWSVPGLAIAVVRNDSVMVAKGYGVRTLGRPEKVDEHTVFDIASLGKAFTATAAAILVDQARLHWDDPVRRHLPDLVLPTPELTAQATVRDFLSHRTGLEAANMMWALTAVDRKEVLRRVQYLRIVTPFRQTLVYSNIGYSVAGEVMSAAAGVPFEDLLRDLVIKPLGLPSTTWSYDQAATMPNLASSHATIAGRQQPIGRERQRQAIMPAAAVQSSVLDLTRWMRLHLNNGMLDGRRLVSDSAMQAIHTKQVGILTTAAMRAGRQVQDSAGVGYAMGWQTLDYRGHPMLWHTGNGDGQTAYMVLLPRERLGTVVVVNTWAAPSLHAALINKVLDTYLGYAPRDWAAEALARVPAMVRAQDSAMRMMVAMRSTNPPPVPLEQYKGRYDHPLFGPLHVRLEGPGLILQMGGGQIADLEYHGGDAFYTRWRDPLAREYYGAHLNFEAVGGAVVQLQTRLNRDEFRAVKSPTG